MSLQIKIIGGLHGTNLVSERLALKTGSYFGLFLKSKKPHTCYSEGACDDLKKCDS
jgi:hypothetical protein